MVFAMYICSPCMASCSTVDNDRLSHIFFASSAIGGVHYGTGRYMTTLTPENIFKAMRVSGSWVRELSCSKLMSELVLVALLLRIFPDDDCS
jgi:hypothetical protein